MLTDKLLQVSTSQVLTATAASTDVIDIGNTQPIGPGGPFWLVVFARTALTGTAPTLQVSIETDDTGAMPSPTILTNSKTYTAVAAGDMIVVPMVFENERFLRARYTLGGTSPNITVDAVLTPIDPRSWKALPAVTGF